MFNLKKQVCSYSFANGLVRGLKQVPFYLGSVTFLILHGQTVEFAMSQVFIYVFSFPKLFSFLLEIMGGVFSYKLGPRGSFISLSLGQFTLALSYVFAAVSFFMPDPRSFLISFAITSFISQIGEALTSGSFEDCYERSIERTKCYESIEEIEISKITYMRFGQFSITFLATLAVVLYAKFGTPLYLSLMFLSGAFLIAYSATLHLSWFQWAKSYFSKKEKRFLSISPQVIFFIKSRDTIFILSTSILYFIYIKFVTLGPLLSTNFLNDVFNSSTSLSTSLSVIISSVLIPFAGFLASKYISTKNRTKLLKEISCSKGVLLITLWLMLLFGIQNYYPLPFLYNLIAISLLSFFFTPIYIWVEWLRIKICNRAIDNGAPVGQNRSLFYSIISGSRELLIGLIAIVYSTLIKTNYLTKDHLLLFFSLTSIFSLLIWITTFKKEKITLDVDLT